MGKLKVDQIFAPKWPLDWNKISPDDRISKAMATDVNRPKLVNLRWFWLWWPLSSFHKNAHKFIEKISLQFKKFQFVEKTSFSGTQQQFGITLTHKPSGDNSFSFYLCYWPMHRLSTAPTAPDNHFRCNRAPIILYPKMDGLKHRISSYCCSLSCHRSWISVALSLRRWYWLVRFR